MDIKEAYKKFRDAVNEVKFTTRLMGHPNIEDAQIIFDIIHDQYPDTFLCIMDVRVNNHELGHAKNSFVCHHSEVMDSRLDLVTARAWGCYADLLACIESANVKPDAVAQA